MENNKKCSSKKHQDINAVSYCIECDIFMCNKCLNHHNEILDHHHKYNLNENINEIFTGICKEKGHKDKLDFYCKSHNQLCCVACLSKVKKKGIGQHTDCNACLIEEIKDEKKIKLKENIKILEDFSKKIENSINELKKIFEDINKNKEELKLKIAKTFTQIRNIINDREDQLLLEVDNTFDNIYFNEEIIRQGKNLPNEIKISLDKGKLIEKEWDNINKLCSIINDCINIEKSISNIREINNNIEKCNIDKLKIIFLPEEKDAIKEFLEKIKIFKIKVEKDNNFIFKFKPGKNYILSNNDLIATKNSGGDCWNCTIVGNKKIPKNKISKWKIRINNFEIKSNTWNILVGIGPDNPNNEINFYVKCWSFICGESQISIKSGSGKRYNNKEYKSLKK